MKEKKLRNWLPRLGCVKDVTDTRDYAIGKLLRARPFAAKVEAGIPEKVSYRNQMTDIRDQGCFGSCVGFATTAMKEWQSTQEHLKEVKAGKRDERKGKPYNLSEAWVYWNCKTIDPWPNEEGTSIRCAMQIIQNKGVPEEDAWPYTDKPNKKGKPKKWAHLVAKWNKSESYYRITKLKQLKKTLAAVGPIVAGVMVTEDFFYPDEKGLIEYNNTQVYGGHAICLVGYNSKKGWIEFKNSWGERWGNRGYGYMTEDYFNATCLDMWVSVDANVKQVK